MTDTKRKSPKLSDMIGTKVRDGLNDAAAERKLGLAAAGRYTAKPTSFGFTTIPDGRSFFYVRVVLKRGPEAPTTTYEGREVDLTGWTHSDTSLDIFLQQVAHLIGEQDSTNLLTLGIEELDKRVGKVKETVVIVDQYKGRAQAKSIRPITTDDKGNRSDAFATRNS